MENGQIGLRVTPCAKTVTVPPTETTPPTASEAVPADAEIIELIVTATRIAEQITDVPASISVVGEEQREPRL